MDLSILDSPIHANHANSNEPSEELDIEVNMNLLMEIMFQYSYSSNKQNQFDYVVKIVQLIYPHKNVK